MLYKIKLSAVLLLANLILSANKLDSLISILNSSKEDSAKVELLCRISSELYFEKVKDTSNFEKGFKYSRQALELSEKLNYLPGKAKSYLQIGNIYFKSENNVKAFENYQLALKIAEQLNYLELIASSANKIGYIHCFVMNNPEKAKSYFFKALDIQKKRGDRKNYARTLANLSDMYSKLNDLTKSFDYEMEAYKISSEIKDSSAMAQITGNIGDYYIRTKQFDKAFKFVTLSRKLQEIRGSEMGVAYNDGRLGTIYYHLEDLKNSESYLLRAYDFATKTNYQELLLSSSEYLWRLNEKLNKSALASFYHVKFYEVKDSINNLEKLARIGEMESERDLERLELAKEKEISFNNLKNEQMKQRQSIIIVSIVVFLIMVLVFTFVIFNRFKISKQQNSIIQKQKVEVELKNELIEEKQKEILDSIHYAKRIQTTLLAHREFINEHVKENFVLFRPKDIVSGDFYWATKKDDLFYFAVCDSTGHGVPGAFMSLLSITFLNEAINERNILQPNEVFNYVRKKLIESVSRDGQKDGFDGILICHNKKTKKMTYAAANNSPVVISSESFEELPSDRMPVGHGVKDDLFKLYEIDLKSNQTLYLYTDGYADQFGGPKGKKLMYKRLNELLVSVSSKNMIDQENVLNDTFNSWKGDLEQIDDVCIVGIRL